MIIDAGRQADARRRHTIFLVAMGAIVIATLAAANAVLLPFVLALVIAYLLTPLVAWVERKKVPRAAAIILVYVAVLGTLGTFVRFTAPRVGLELASLRRELPALQHAVRSRWVPALQQRLRDAGFGPEHSSDAPPVPDARHGDGHDAREREGSAKPFAC